MSKTTSKDWTEMEKKSLVVNMAKEPTSSMVIEGVAVGLRQNPENQRWEVIEVEFNATTKQFKILNIIDGGETKMHAFSKYHLSSIRHKNIVP